MIDISIDFSMLYCHWMALDCIRCAFKGDITECLFNLTLCSLSILSG